MIKAVLFDVDKVIIIPPGYGSQYALSQDGPGQTDVSEFFRGIFLDCQRGTKDMKEELQPFLQKWGYRKNVDDFIKTWFDYENHVDERMIEQIKTYRDQGIMCALATRQEKYRLDYIKNEMRFKNYVDKIYASCEIGHNKPELKYFQYVLADVGVEPQEILFWDNEELNVEAAKKLGMNAEVYTDFESFLEKMKEYDY